MVQKKDDMIELTIEDMNETGEGVAKLDGYIWFVKDAIIGDIIEAKVMKTKKSYGFARMINLIKPSPYRVEAPCPVAKRCGGCQLQAMAYEEQLRYKERKAYHNLLRIGKFTESELNMLPIIGMDDPWRYRNKAQFPFGVDRDGHIITGFYAGRTHSIIAHEDCLLGVEVNQEILKIVKQFMEQHGIRTYDEESHRGLVRHVLIRVGFWTKEIMVCLVINGTQLPHSDELVEALLKVEGMADISLNINKERTNVILGKKIVGLYGSGYITDYIGEVSYRISPLSFYQVNPIQTKKLYETALEYADLTGEEIVWDLYCGIGTITLFLAQKAKEVYGVEVVPEAILDARENAKRNHISNVKFFAGSVEEVLPAECEKNQVVADVVVIDPPRKGCDTVCLDAIVNMAPNRVVYVSCDSATLARDLRYLCDRGYALERVRCCDMFAQCAGVESVALLVRN